MAPGHQRRQERFLGTGGLQLDMKTELFERRLCQISGLTIWFLTSFCLELVVTPPPLHAAASHPGSQPSPHPTRLAEPHLSWPGYQHLSHLAEPHYSHCSLPHLFTKYLLRAHTVPRTVRGTGGTKMNKTQPWT